MATVVTKTPSDGQVAAPAVSRQPELTAMTNGAAAAAILAAAIGCAVLGLIIPISEAIVPFKNALNWWNPVGPLVGKTSTAVIGWLVAWAVLHVLWRDKEVPFGKIWVIGLVLIGIGFLGSFPPFYEMFTAH